MIRLNTRQKETDTPDRYNRYITMWMVNEVEREVGWRKGVNIS